MSNISIIAVANQKGGVGKTTTVINLGASLAMNNREILMIDFDPQTNTTSGFGMDSEREKNVCSLILGKHSLEEVVVQTEVEGLYLVQGSRDLAGLEIELAGAEEREFLLAESLEKRVDRFDYVLIDCPPSLGLLTINALVAAKEVLITLQSEYYALEGLSHLMSTIKNVRKRWNTELTINGVVLTMFDSRLKLSREVAENVKDNLGSILYKTCIPRNVKLSEAPSYGMPAILYDARSKGAASYLNLAKEVLQR